MNKVELIGRMTRDPEGSTYGNDGKTMVRFSIAVNRNYKNAEGNYDADFPNCVAFDKTAEFILKNFHQGKPIEIVGHIQTGNYTNKDGVKVYTTDIIVENVSFVVGSKPDSDSSSSKKQNDDDSYMNIPDGVDEELPFN